MPQSAAFHHVRKQIIFRDGSTFYWGFLTSDPLICAMKYPRSTLSYQIGDCLKEYMFLHRIRFAKLFKAAKIHVCIMRSTCCLNVVFNLTNWGLICLHDITLESVAILLLIGTRDINVDIILKDRLASDVVGLIYTDHFLLVSFRPLDKCAYLIFFIFLNQNVL